MGECQKQGRQRQVSCRTLAALVSHRFLDVGYQRGAFDADCLSQCGIYHGYRVGQLCLVCLRVHRIVGLCICPTLSGQQGAHTARVYGAAFRTVNAKHAGMVHHRHRAHLMACPDIVCRRHHHPPGVWRSHVDIGVLAARHLCILHHARRTEGGGLHQCLSDGAAHLCVGHTHHCGHLSPGRRLVLGWHIDIGQPRHRAFGLLEPVPA